MNPTVTAVVASAFVVVVMVGRRRRVSVAPRGGLDGSGTSVAGQPSAPDLDGLATPTSVRRRRTRAADAARAVPDLIELFLVAARAGHGPSSAVRVVAPRAPRPLRAALGDVVDRLDRGLGLADALDHLTGALGASATTLVAALRTAAATGAPLASLLEGAVAVTRDVRRREAEARARRLPVAMLVPLVACILPAAIVLAVVPVLLVSLDSLST